MASGTEPAEGEPRTGPVKITVIDYDASRYEEKEVQLVEECFPYRDTSTVTWINIDGLSDTRAIEEIGQCYSIHPLILNDLQNTGQHDGAARAGNGPTRPQALLAGPPGMA